MAAKINLISKDKEYGNQLITVDTSKLDMLGTHSDEGIQDKIAQKVAEGYYCFEFKGASGSVYYVSKEPDGLVRDLEGVEWYKNIKLFNAESDHLQWLKNIDLWFSKALADEEYVASINSMCQQALETIPKNNDAPFDVIAEFEEAKQWLKSQQPTKKGGTAKRPSDINSFLTKSNTGYLPRSIKAFINWNGSKGGWKAKRFWR